MKLTRSLKILFVLTALSLAIKIYFTKFGFYHIDLITFQLWSLELIRHGFGQFYNIEHSIYPPGYLYALWFTGKVYYWLINHSFMISAELMFKLPSLFSDCLNGILIYLTAKKFTTEKLSLIAAAAFLFNPAFFANSTYWGQVDSFISLFLLSSLYFLMRGNNLLAIAFLGIGITVKPYAILSVPIFLLYLYLQKMSLRRIALYGLTLFLVSASLFIPFSQGNIFAFIAGRFSTALIEWPAATSNAFNFWALISIFNFGTMEGVTDMNTFLNISYWVWGIFIFGIIYLGLASFFMRRFHKAKEKITLIVATLALSYFTMFIFLTRMHERHLYFGLIFLTLLFPVVRTRLRVLIAVAYILYTLNLYYAYRLTTAPIFYLSPQASAGFSLVNVSILIYLLKDFITKKGRLL